MNKTLLALGTSLFLSASLASAMPSSNLEINVEPMDGGAWVKVTKEGQPLSGVKINGEYTTPESGRVFVRVHSESASSAEFVATTADNQKVSTHAFIPRQ